MARLEFQVIQSKQKDQWRFLLGEIKTNSLDSLSCKLERNGQSRNHNVLGVDISTQRTTAMQVNISAQHWLHTLGSCALPTFYTVTMVSQSPFLKSIDGYGWVQEPQRILCTVARVLPAGNYSLVQ